MKNKIWSISVDIDNSEKKPRDIFNELGGHLYTDTEGVFNPHITTHASYKEYGISFYILYWGTSYKYELFKTKSKGINTYPLVLEYGLSDDKYTINNHDELTKTLYNLVKNPLTSKLLGEIHIALKKDDK